MVVLPFGMNPLLLLTLIVIGTVPPATAEKVVVLPVVASVKVSVVGLTVRLTTVVLVALPLVPVMVIAWAPEGRAILAAVVIVSCIVPFGGTLPELLNMQAAPTGSPVQLLGVNDTVPVKPPAGVTVIVDTADCPALTVKADGLGDKVKGVVTVTVVTAGNEVLLDASPWYVAVTLLEPTGSADVVNVAVPVCDGG